MKLPETVRIGPYTYTLEMCDEIRNSDDVRLAGQIDYNAQVIKLLKGMSEMKTVATFWHEVIHGIDDVSSIGLKEKQVLRLESGLMSFFVDNDMLGDLHDQP